MSTHEDEKERFIEQLFKERYEKKVDEPSVSGRPPGSAGVAVEV